MSQQAERRVGSIIGSKWRVDALLGSGSMAAVYAVTHRNGARAALKILHPTLCTDPAVCERFLGEGYLANSVKHSGIVRVLDDGVTDDGCVFLTMDLLEGDTLEALRQKRGNRIPLAEALELGDKLMDVLSAVHAAGIIHRDLKPQNVFVCNDGVLKLLDFGVARVFDRTSQSKLSMFGLVLGTPSFMSPEQALGSRDKVDHRSDIWSFGATLFTALTGETVHLGANIQAKLLAAATVKARTITMVMPDLPAGISSAIDMALRFKKEERWQSVDAMRRAFREARDNAGLGRRTIPPEGGRAYDMSLDESTHVDKGKSRLADSQPPPSYESDRTQTFRIGTIPPEGPGGTFIGVGSEGKIVAASSSGSVTAPRGIIAMPPMGVKSLPPPLPARARASSISPDGPVPMSFPSQAPRSAPNPAAVVRRMPTPAAALDLRSSRPDPYERAEASREGSIPAYGNTLNFGADENTRDIDPRVVGRRKSSFGVWMGVVLVAAAAFGGVAFFAVKRAPLHPDDAAGAASGAETSNPVTPVTSATLTPPASASSMIITAPPVESAQHVASSAATLAVSTKDASAPARPTSASTAKASNGGGGGHAPRNRQPPATTTAATTAAPTTPTPTPTATTDPTATQDPPVVPAQPLPPGLAPDPFGTPE